MNILHYALGFPPYRTGGLTTFCMDLMQQQAKDGHRVALLWPGQMGFVRKKVSVKDRGDVVLGGGTVRSYEIINPLPVSYDEGISAFAAFTADAGEPAYMALLRGFAPDVLHVHTLMGLHRSLLTAAKKLGVRLVFTTHDYFPFCPKVTLFRDGMICADAQSCARCGGCNATALGLRKIQLLQSPLYRRLKDSALVKRLRKRHRDKYLHEDTAAATAAAAPVGSAEDYRRLRAYYTDLLGMMDCIHYNSTVTKAVYESFAGLPEGRIVSITHAGIADHRKKKQFSDDCLRIRYLGPQSASKGYFLLRRVLDQLWNEGKRFRLDVHFTPTEPAPFMQAHARYSYAELETIFEDTDVLVVPSIWYETFGYTVLEALSYGVPVIVSDTVGAKDILPPQGGIIVQDEAALLEALRELDTHKLETMNQAILDKLHIQTEREFAERMGELYANDGK